MATVDIKTNTLTNVEKDFLVGIGGESIIIDHSRNRFICLGGIGIQAFNYNTHELISEATVAMSGTGPVGLFINERRNELIVVHRGYDSTGAISILNMDDFTEKHKFYTKYAICGPGVATGPGQVALDKERSNLFIFYPDPDYFEVYSLDSSKFIYSADLPEYYVSPNAVIDYKNDRILLSDGMECKLSLLINLNDFTVQNLNVNECINVNQYSIDTISNRIWQGNTVRDLNTYEILGYLDLPENYDVYYVFSCPKFNYIYGSFGNYLLIFDLDTYNYLGKVEVGSSPEKIVIDHKKNNFFIKEGQNAEIKLFNDFKSDEIPRVIKKNELYENNINGINGFEIIPERNEIAMTGSGKVILYNYVTNNFNFSPVDWTGSIEASLVNDRIFVGQGRYGPNETHRNELYVMDFNLNVLWDLYVPMVNSDLAYDDERYLYYLSTESGYYPGNNKIYKIDTEQKEIVDSIKIGNWISKMEYSKKYNRLYALNRHDYPGGYSQYGYPGCLYEIDCNSLTCIDSTTIPYARIGHLAESIETMFIYKDDYKLVCYDIESDSLISEQSLPDGIDPRAINLNQVTNTLYIVDNTTGSVYKYRNDTLPGPEPPATPFPPTLDVGDNQIVIRWEKNDIVAAYNLYRKTDGDDWMCVTFKPIVDTFYRDLNLINNIEYSYALSLLGEYYIEGEKSAAVTGIPIDMPDFEISRVYSDNICSNDSKDALFTFGINQESAFNDTIMFSLLNIPNGILLTDADLIKYNEDFLSIKLISDGTAAKGNYSVTLVAEGGGQTHTIDFPLQVVDQINIILDYNPKELTVGDWISIEGNTYPLTGESLVVNMLNSDKLMIEQDTIQSDGNGVFRTEYTAMMSDTILIYASLINHDYQSDTLSVFINPGDVSVSCVANVTDSTGIGWNVQITGMVFPNPHGGTVKLQITSPYDSVQFVENIPMNEFGYYGHTFKPDTTGLWKINAYFNGNQNYSAAASYTNFVPIGIKSGYAIIFTGDVSSESSALDTTFRNLGKYVYNVLQSRHLGKEDIYLIYPEVNVDIDLNEQNDDVDSMSSINSIKAAIEWAKTNIQDSLDLIMYLVSTGDTGSFRVNGTESLPIDSLNKWIRDFSLVRDKSKINIIIEDSWGEEYITKLAGTNRRIIVATNDSVDYFFNYGDISFSGYFWSNIAAGLSVGESFIQTRSILNSFPDLFFGQECLADANNNIVSNEQEDYDLLSDVYIGYGTMIDNFAPEITGSTIDTDIDLSGLKKKKSGFTLKEVQQSNLYLSVLIKSAMGNLKSVYAILIKNEGETKFKLKSLDQLTDYKVYELNRHANTDYYVAKVDEFFDIGDYTFVVYAENNSGIKAYPEYSQFSIIEVTQTGINKETLKTGLNINVYPNPFSSNMTVEYELDERSETTVKLYNESGILIDIIEHGIKNPGPYSIEYSNNGLNNGVYFVSIELKNPKSRIIKTVICVK
jgi:hypothetical protein